MFLYTIWLKFKYLFSEFSTEQLQNAKAIKVKVTQKPGQHAK